MGDVDKQNNVLTSTQICDIIASCAKGGVSLLKFGDLHVEFGVKPTRLDVDPVMTQFTGPTNAPAFSSPPGAEIPESQHTQMTNEALEQDELLTRDDQIAMMLIEDPQRAEQLLRDGELEDADDFIDDADTDDAE